MRQLTSNELSQVTGGDGTQGGASLTYTDPQTGVSYTGGGYGDQNGNWGAGGEVSIPFGPGDSSNPGGVSGSGGVGNSGVNSDPSNPSSGVSGPWNTPDDRRGFLTL